MNKKTFTFSVVFLIATIAWLLLNLYWIITGPARAFEIVLPVLFVVFAASMVWNETQKKKRRHIDEINKHKIP